MEDQPADPGDLTTDKAESDEVTAEEPEAKAVETEAEKPRRRRRFPWQRRAEKPAEEASDASEAEAVEVARSEPSPEARPKRTPVGKGRRAVAATEPEPEPEPESKAELEVEPEPEPRVEAEAVEPESPAEEEHVEETNDEEATDEAPEEAPADEQATDEQATEEPEPVLVPYRPAGKRLTYAAVGAAALFVVGGAFAGAAVQPYLADRALVDTKLQVAQTSADAITTLWTYTPDNIESLPDRASRFLSNDFAAEYRKFIDSIVPSNKQAQISNNTEVVGTAVESISPTEATAIVYTNSVSTSPVTKNVPSLRYLSYRLSLTRSDGDWRITQMPALTQLDLSPQL